MIGILRWLVKLRRIDTITEGSFLLLFNVSPRKDHLEAAYRVFEYLYHYKTGGRVVFNDAKPEVNEGHFREVNWKSIYENLTKDIPSNMPEPRGNPVTILMFYDAAFAGDLFARRSLSSIFIFINSSPITWYSKQ